MSVSVGSGSGPTISRAFRLRQSSELLLTSIDEALAEANCLLSAVDGIVALRGPGSFTGLRIGLATALGLHQTTGIRATGLETLETQALAVCESQTSRDAVLISFVDAMKGEYFAQRYRDGKAIDRAQRVSAAEMSTWQADGLVGFGAPELCATLWSGKGPTPLESPALAPTALRMASKMASSRDSWDSSLLSQPVYFRAPAARPITAPLG